MVSQNECQKRRVARRQCSFRGPLFKADRVSGRKGKGMVLYLLPPLIPTSPTSRWFIQNPQLSHSLYPWKTFFTQFSLLLLVRSEPHSGLVFYMHIFNTLSFLCYPEEGNIFLQNVGNQITDFTVSYARRHSL
jgi:hypothetical protein